MRICLLGANGFIGSHLSEAILNQTDWHIDAMDLSQDKLTACLSQPRFHFMCGDITQNSQWVEDKIKQCDVLLPLVAIATPALYISEPLRVFELDFEANLKLIRLCAQYQKRVIFPSTSEVYGMCPDEQFDEEQSVLVTGPIQKERWIYSASKQLLDRLIYAYGKKHQLAYTLFRPFNWYGPRLDNPHNTHPGGSRVLTQFIGNFLRGENISLVNGGLQMRSFMFIEDGIRALMRIIENSNHCATGRVFNLGNPAGNVTIYQLATMIQQMIIDYYPRYADCARQTQLLTVAAEDYFGEGYQDVSRRVPNIERAKTYLQWAPRVELATGLRRTLDFYLVK